MAYFSYEPHGCLTIERLCVEQFVVTHGYRVDSQLVELDRVLRQVDAIACWAWKPTISSVISGLPASSRTAVASAAAFRASMAAWSTRSGLNEDTALSQCLVDHRAGHVAPFIDMFCADDDDVQGDFEVPQLAAQASRLGPTLRDFAGLYDKQVEIAIRTGLATCARAKEDHSCSRRCLGKPLASLLDQMLVRHRVKVAQSLDGFIWLGADRCTGDPGLGKPQTRRCRGEVRFSGTTRTRGEDAR